MKSRIGFLSCCAIALAVGCESGEEGAQPDAGAPPPEQPADTHVVPPGATLPPGYELRLDRANADASAFTAADENGALVIRTGPHGILYRPESAVAQGDYTISGTLTELDAPRDHRESYGIFFGGSDLQGDAQRYSYFLVRGDGQYNILRRDASSTESLVDGWKPSRAVRASAGEYTNTLEVRVAADRVHFSINGAEVAALPAERLDTHGIAGIRASHNLHLRVADWSMR
jgi:hypothetical protein